MTIGISDDLATGILHHLQNGGSRIEANSLAALLIHTAQEPLRQAEAEKMTQHRIDTAVASALASSPAPAPEQDEFGDVAPSHRTGRGAKTRHPSQK